MTVRQRKLMLACLCVAAALFLGLRHGGGQQHLTQQQQTRWEQAARETAFVEVRCRVGGGILVVTSAPPQAPNASAIHFVGFTSPAFNFAASPTFPNVKAGEYRAEGRQGARYWHITVTDGGFQKKGFYVGYDAPRPTVHLLVRDGGKTVCEVGTEMTPAVAEPGQPAMIVEPAIVIEERQKRTRR